MHRGRKPKPTALKRLHRTERKDRAVNEPSPPSGDMLASDMVNGTPFAREIWEHYLASAPYGMLKPVDLPLLERLCIALAMAKTAQEQVNKAGLVVMMGQKMDEAGKIVEKGVAMQNPFLPIVNRQTEIARKLASELGLPVTARARLDMPDAPTAAHTAEAVKRDRPSAKHAKPQNLEDFIAGNPQQTLQ